MTITKKEIDSYDEIKGMLNKIRKIQSIPKYGVIQEQTYQGETEEPQGSLKFAAPFKNGQGTKTPIDNPEPEESRRDNEEVSVINNVDVEIHSEDITDQSLEDDEKGTISQLIDDFKAEVSEIAEFDGLHIYPETAVLNGKVGDSGIKFTFQGGNDNGLYLSTSMTKIDSDSLDMINRLSTFAVKFTNTINDILVNRRDT